MLFGKKKRRINHLLIVEDEPLVAFDTEHFLTEEGFEIAATVNTVAEALAHLGSATMIDLVLVDVALADGSGIAVAEAAHARGVRVLFVTGGCPDDARGVAAGCLAKPYAQRDLLQAIGVVDDVLRGRKPRRAPGGFNLFLEATA
ncbi:MAG TPA: response regulator [Sphingomonas sp.]|nr:response regulator [Sphingomonas sp.]